jgi:hypothetical protein
VPKHDSDDGPPGLDAVADALYTLPPEDFVGARDDRVAQAREDGDRELAKAIGRLRRPTRPAWLANLLARRRAEQIEGLVGLAAGLAEAQRTLDGDTLRALSGQRHRVVAAMAREAGRLAQEAGSPATDAQLRELQGILEAALAQPEIAEEVRAGRLTRTLSYTGFGPAAEPGAVSAPPAARAQARPEPEHAGPDQAERERAERERAERERAEREREAAAAEAEAAAAREELDAAEAARDEAREQHVRARDRVAELTAQLDAARDDERAAAEAVKATTAAARESARAATAATARADRARARVEG